MMLSIRKIVVAGVLFLAVGIANSAVSVCSGATSPVGGGFQMAAGICSVPLSPNQMYQADLTVTPGAGSVFNDWSFNIAGLNVVGGDSSRSALTWWDDSAQTLSVSFATSSLPADAYALVAGWSYSNLPSSFSMSVTAVPEAPVWFMMLAGLGLLGWVLRRQNGVRAESIAA